MHPEKKQTRGQSSLRPNLKNLISADTVDRDGSLATVANNTKISI
jgi:hypothetical protein